MTVKPTKSGEKADRNNVRFLPLTATCAKKLSNTFILIYKHLETALQHTKTSAEVELQVDAHLTTLETACQQTKTSADVELHVDSRLTTLETAWQHIKTSPRVELHVDSHLHNTGNSMSAHQNKCRS